MTTIGAKVAVQLLCEVELVAQLLLKIDDYLRVKSTTRLEIVSNLCLRFKPPDELKSVGSSYLFSFAQRGRQQTVNAANISAMSQLRFESRVRPRRRPSQTLLQLLFV